MIIGNRKGKVGLGVAQGSDVSGAINKAIGVAKKTLINVKRLDSTISYRVDSRFCGAQIMIKPAKDGKGIVAGGAMRLIFELAGIRNITAKSLGSSNKINIAKATLKALEQLEGKKNELNRQKITREKTSEKKVIKKKVSKKVETKKSNSKAKKTDKKTVEKKGNKKVGSKSTKNSKKVVK
jgi:small subunit ribosomal protein S5